MPLGLDPAERQIRLLRGLAARCRDGSRQYRERVVAQQAEVAALEKQIQAATQELQRNHYQQRFDRLADIDRADESTSVAYERGTFVARKSRTEVKTRINKQRRQQRQQIQAEAQQKRQAALDQFEKSKDEPEKHRVKQKARAEQALRPIMQVFAEAQQLALTRLGTPELKPAKPIGEVTRPTSIEAGLETIQDLTQQASLAYQTAVKAPARRWADGWGMVIFFVGAAILWLGGVAAVRPPQPVLWALGSLVCGGFVAFFANLMFTPAIRRHTRQWLPQVAEFVETSKLVGRGILDVAKSEAADLAASIVRKRDEALRAADEWRDHSLQELDRRMDAELAAATDALNRQLQTLEQEYRSGVSQQAGDTQTVLADTAARSRAETQALNQKHQTMRQEMAALHRQQLTDIATRVRSGLQRGLKQIGDTSQKFAAAFPDWSSVLDGAPKPQAKLERIPVGHLRIGEYLQQQLSSDEQASVSGAATSESPAQLDVREFLPESLPDRLPVSAIVGQNCGVWIECPAEQMEVARRFVQAMLMRILSATTAGRVRLLLLDPIGRGQSFAPLMALADHDPELVGHRAWAGPEQIDARLAEYTQHMEDILQTYLRDRFTTIDQYNALAGSMAEPYRVIAAIGLPAGLTSPAAGHLRALVEGGPRCGIITILVTDPATPWPRDLPTLPRERFLQLRISETGQWQHTQDLLATLPLDTINPPAPAVQGALVERIGYDAANADRVIIPFDEIAAVRCNGEGDTAEGFAAPLGRQGVGRTVELELGEGVRQHVLVAGKTGSGKSSLLHTLITSAAMRYSPDQLHLYLLDFKKGVEFKLYADLHLPHARVIGIESEREFGKSVLEKLDQELHRRGELFRAQGVQELAEYRRRSQATLPRIVLVVDEFQELFVRDDRIAQECTMLLDRLVRQGRSFGVHAILASQSLAGAYSLPRNTLGQMAVRIALQCSESDAGLILADDNTAARLLSRPGEAIYNDAGGLVEGNQPFQVAWLDHTVHSQRLESLEGRYPQTISVYGPPVIFEGNRPATWNPDAIDLSLREARKKREAATEWCGVLGESVAIGPPVHLRFSRQAGRNLLIVCAEQPLVRDILGTLIPSLVADANGRMALTYLAGRPDAVEDTPVLRGVREHVAQYQFVRPREAEATIVAIAEEVKRRVAEGEDQPHPPHLVVIEPLERFRDLRHDEAAAFSFDANKAPGPEALSTILREGPAVGVHAVVCCGGSEAFSRWLSRSSQHDLELRLLGRLSTSDAAQLTDSADAASLGPAAMLLYDEALGRNEKLRVYNLPDADQLARWLPRNPIPSA